MLVQDNGAKRPAPVRDMSALAAAAPELDLKTPCKIYEISGTPQNINRVILDYSKKITGNMFLGVEQLEESHEE